MYDVAVIGSGFGGTMVAHELVRAGMRVLMLERGESVDSGGERRDSVWDFFQLRPAYDTEAPYPVTHRGRTGTEGRLACVGGASVFYGGASFRLRESDFNPGPEIVGESGTEWPFGYAELEPFYTRAEQLLNVAGEIGTDPTEPERSAPYPRTLAPLAPISREIAAAALRLGLHPSRIPLALEDGCTTCTSSDGYASGGVARIIHDLLRAYPGFELREQTVAVRLLEERGRIVGVECVERGSGRRETIRAGMFILAAGALASPHLLLASGLERLNPGGHTVGAYLMRHCNAFVYGFFPNFPDPDRHHKQIAINDFYGVDEGRKLGNIQQVMHPQLGGVLRVPAAALRRTGLAGRTVVGALARGLRPVTHRMTGLQVIAEDQPQARNRVEADWSTADRWGVPRLRIHHDYTGRDLAARAELIRRAKEILREAHAFPWLYTYRVTTFSHAVGTVRMGRNEKTSALDEYCRFRGVENLFVTDGGFMPTSGGVNPSLTIAANALRVGAYIAGPHPGATRHPSPTGGRGTAELARQGEGHP